MQSAQMSRVLRPLILALGLAATAALLLRAATGCSTSTSLAGSPDAGQDVTGTESGATSDAGGVSLGCNGGCLCFAVDACPGGCFVSQTVQPDGAASALFCSNGIVACARGGGAWSLGDISNSCPVPDYPPVYLDGSSGAFCCVVQDAATDGPTDDLPGDAPDEAIDTGADAAADANAQ